VPWLGPLLTAGSAAIGRLVAVNLAPSAILAVTVWLAVRADAFTSTNLRPGDVFASFPLDAGGVLIFVLLVFGLAILLQPFDIHAVRLLEGYWSGTRLGAAVANVAAVRHRRRFQFIEDGLDAADKSVEDALVGDSDLPGLPIEEQARRHRDWSEAKRKAGLARRWRPLYPPSKDEVMPTMLGNVLRAAERRAGERYHLPTVESLPRLHQHFSDRMAAAYNAAVDALDAAAMMTLSTALACVVSVVAYFDDAAMYWLPIGLGVASLLSYRGAIVAAAQHGLFMETAFDLHRFDLIKALHLDLPRDADEERTIGERLHEFWKCVDVDDARDEWEGVKYWHYDETLRPAENSYPPDDKGASPGRYL